MELRKSERKRAKIKMALQGSSGSGKTMSSLLLAKGLTNGNFEKVAIIDSENGSADLYSHLGNYNVLSLKPPFTPESYIKAIEVCEKAGMEVVVIDGISQCWDELVDCHSKLAGNSFVNWSKIMPRHKAFINKILQSPVHIIATMRTKQDYVLNQKNGKFIPEKVGLKAIQKGEVDYEFTLVFDIDIKHNVISSKDRTGLFMDKPEFKITEKTGERLLKWCNSTPKPTEKEVIDKINSALSVSELSKIYQQYPSFQQVLAQKYTSKKKQLEHLINPQNFSTNGTTINTH